MKAVFLLLCCCFTVAVKAQVNVVNSSKAQNDILISLNPQWYLNKGSVYNDGHNPDVISAKNTIGYAIGLEYEHISKKGLVLNVGLLYGQEHHNVNVTYKDLSFFDTINKENLNKISDVTNYTATTNYIGLRFMVGYRWALNSSFLNGWALESKVGLSLRAAITGQSAGIIRGIAYDRNDTLYITNYGSDAVNFGGKSTFGSPIWSKNADLYIGMTKSAVLGPIKSISFGLTATYGIGGRYKGLGDVSARTYNFAQQLISIDEYRSKDFSIGARVAIGLWR